MGVQDFCNVIATPNLARGSEVDLIVLSTRPLTPSASDCLSSCAESEHDCNLLQSPVKREPALLVERLEHASRKAMGRSKRRKAAHEAGLARLVEDMDVDMNTLLLKPYRSSFTEVLESSVNMMVWNHFTSLSEEEQKQYLSKGYRKRTKLNPIREETSNAKDPEKGVKKTTAAVNLIQLSSDDGREIHPAAVSAIYKARGVRAKGDLRFKPLLNLDLSDANIPKPLYLDSKPGEWSRVPVTPCTSVPKSWKVEVLVTETANGMALVGPRELLIANKSLIFTVAQDFHKVYKTSLIPLDDMAFYNRNGKVFSFYFGDLHCDDLDTIKVKFPSENACESVTEVLYRYFTSRPPVVLSNEQEALNASGVNDVLRHDAGTLSLSDLEISSDDSIEIIQ